MSLTLRGFAHRVRLAGARAIVALGHALRLGSFLRLDFPPSRLEVPRYGWGRPSHPRLTELVAAERAAYATFITSLETYAAELSAIAIRDPAAGEPAWVNGFLPGLDGAALYAWLRERSPKTYLEIGSGNSTRFAARAKRDGALDTRIVSIDPAPRVEVEALCDEVHRCALEQVDLGLFELLHPGDVVFFDGSHRVFSGSDATVFFLDVLPSLPAGVLVCVHDVYLPEDYPPDIADRHYSEQYLLAGWLLAAPRSLRIRLAASYASRDAELGAQLEALWAKLGLTDIEGHGVGFWFEVAPEA